MSIEPLEWVQPNSDLHIYYTKDGAYRLSRNEDQRSWSLHWRRKLINDRLNSRADGYILAQEYISGKGVVEDMLAETRLERLMKIDFKALPSRQKQMLLKLKDGPKSLQDVEDETGWKWSFIISTAIALELLTLVSLRDNSVELGDGVLEFINRNKPPSEPSSDLNSGAGFSGEETSAYDTWFEDQLGIVAPVRKANSGLNGRADRPQDSGPPISELEFQQARWKNASASLEYAIASRRRHPFSPLAKGKVLKAEERLRSIQTIVDHLSN